jgi:hypothetical protein
VLRGSWLLLARSLREECYTWTSREVREEVGCYLRERWERKLVATRERWERKLVATRERWERKLVATCTLVARRVLLLKSATPELLREECYSWASSVRQVATNLLLFSLLRLSGWREKRTRERERERER